MASLKNSQHLGIRKNYPMVLFKVSRALVTLMVLAGALLAQAATDEDDEFFQTSGKGAEKVQNRAYSGSRDEQALEIQAVLPQPSRSPDSTFALTNDSGSEQSTAPASD